MESSKKTLQKPAKGTFPDYYDKYISVLPNDIFDYLDDQVEGLVKFFDHIPKTAYNYAYAQGKWTVKEVLIHINDTERIFGYRSLCISRNEAQNLPGFDQETYINNIQASDISMDLLVEEFKYLRKSNLAMFHQVHALTWDNLGKASNFSVPLRMFPFVMAGHVDHHIKILQNRYI